MELREIEKWDVIEEYSKDFSYFFSLVSRRFVLLRRFSIFVQSDRLIRLGVKDRDAHLPGREVKELVAFRE